MKGIWGLRHLLKPLLLKLHSVFRNKTLEHLRQRRESTRTWRDLPVTERLPTRWGKVATTVPSESRATATTKPPFKATIVAEELSILSHGTVSSLETCMRSLYGHTSVERVQCSLFRTIERENILTTPLTSPTHNQSAHENRKNDLGKESLGCWKQYFVIKIVKATCATLALISTEL